MSDIWRELIKLLNDIGEEYLKMIELAEQKRDALVTVQVETVNKLIIEEETLLKSINSLESKRVLLVERIAGANGWTDQKIKLLDLVERSPAEFAGQMKQTGQRLADIVMRIALLNGINNNLLKQAMQIIEYNINLLSNAQATPFYDAGGGQPQRDGKGGMGLSVFDRKA